MFNLFFKIIKRIIMSSLLIYSFDLIAVYFNFTIPINVVTVSLVSIFDFSALFSLVLFSFSF